MVRECQGTAEKRASLNYRSIINAASPQFDDIRGYQSKY
jgi:hypothetical protein